MAKECFYTKLKSVIMNDDLEKLGEMRIQRNYIDNEVASNAYMSVSRNSIPVGETLEIEIIGDGFFSISYGGDSLGKKLEITRQGGASAIDQNAFHTSNGTYVIVINSKYNYNSSQINKGYDVDFSQIFYTPISYVSGVGYKGNFADLNTSKINYINMGDGNVGKIIYTDEDIKGLTLLTNLTLFSILFPEISMSALGHLINLQGNNNIMCAKGSIEDFVTAQRANGRTSFSDTLNLKWLGEAGKVTFNGATIATGENGLLTWTANTITFRGETINA